MNVEIGTEAAQFPEKEYINGIFVAGCLGVTLCLLHYLWCKAAEPAILRVMLRLCTTPSSASTTPFLLSSGQRVHQITIEDTFK